MGCWAIGPRAVKVHLWHVPCLFKMLFFIQSDLLSQPFIQAQPLYTVTRSVVEQLSLLVLVVLEISDTAKTPDNPRLSTCSFPIVRFAYQSAQDIQPWGAGCGAITADLLAQNFAQRHRNLATPCDDELVTQPLLTTENNGLDRRQLFLQTKSSQERLRVSRKAYHGGALVS